jgi:hypothetical protein
MIVNLRDMAGIINKREATLAVDVYFIGIESIKTLKTK